MTDVLSLPDAEQLAARLMREFGPYVGPVPPTPALARLAADRARVESDLAGLRRHDWHVRVNGTCFVCRIFSDNLRRTASLYGVPDA